MKEKIVLLGLIFIGLIIFGCVQSPPRDTTTTQEITTTTHQTTTTSGITSTSQTNGDGLDCEAEQNPVGKDMCYRARATAENDPSLCQKIQSPTSRQACLEFLNQT
ncbi:hypothetical protein HY991_00020 [Candidatus Micrarchaeota archaeon]|nr:hypothetical protein [Candidatus Micrarchaeota archaeon]